MSCRLFSCDNNRNVLGCAAWASKPSLKPFFTCDGCHALIGTEDSGHKVPSLAVDDELPYFQIKIAASASGISNSHMFAITGLGRQIKGFRMDEVELILCRACAAEYFANLRPLILNALGIKKDSK